MRTDKVLGSLLTWQLLLYTVHSSRMDIQEPPAVRMNDELGGLLSWKLAGEDAIRASGVPFAIVRPCALTGLLLPNFSTLLRIPYSLNLEM